MPTWYLFVSVAELTADAETSLNITKQSLEEAAKEDPALAADIQSFLPILQTLGSEVGGILGKVFGSLHL